MTITIGELAGKLASLGVKTGRTRLFKFLREEGYLNYNNLPNDKYLELGLFSISNKTYYDSEGLSRDKEQAMVTPKGVAYITNLFNSNGKCCLEQLTLF